jgi:nicotinamide-nucleotide adenylyltransferase
MYPLQGCFGEGSGFRETPEDPPNRIPARLDQNPVFLYTHAVQDHAPIAGGADHPNRGDWDPVKRNIRRTEPLGRIGMVARWQPVHLGHAPVLRALCDGASQALIGIGSSNRHGLRNPFTLEERSDMIRLVLAGRRNFTLVPVPDLDDGPRWRLMVLDLFGPLDRFVTANPYVASLLSEDYGVIRPVDLVPEDAKIAIDGTMVRQEMARGDGWQDLVPTDVADYITTRRLDVRFRREFGLQTLALDAFRS